ncbi:hypothetical protein LBMAG42_23190 [Deltaproteobacteria bacterium]|nr:hypothetical protein LBMAG42_23190 [Deltaproteobacteria bacterium]
MTARSALTAASAFAIVPLAYAAQRCVEVGLGGELDPALVPPSPRIALFWRVGVSLVLAAGSTGPFYRLAERSPALALRVAEALAALAFGLLVAQAVFAP